MLNSKLLHIQFSIIHYIYFLRTKRLSLKLIFLYTLFTCQLSFSQKLYWGFGLSSPLISHVTVEYDYLSDSPFNNQDIKILDKKSINHIFSPGNDAYDLTGGLYGHFGYQLNATFFDLNATLINAQTFSIKTEYPQGYHPDEHGYYVNSFSFIHGGLFLSVKQNITGRRKIKVLPSVGYGMMLPYTTKYNEEQKYFDLNKFSYQIAQASIMFLHNEGVYVELKYNYLIDKFAPEISYGFFEITFGGLSYFLGFKTEDRIYFGE